MSPHDVSDVPIWPAVLERLLEDERVTPQLQGFLNLVVPSGVYAGVLYLDVPNDLTAAQINKRLRLPLMEALTKVDAPEPATSFRVAVNPELIDAHLTAPTSMQRSEEHTSELQSLMSTAYADFCL